MDMFKRSSFAVVALLSLAANAQNSNINFAQCAVTEDTRTQQTGNTFSDGLDGSERRTYGILCSGSKEIGSTDTTTTDIESRNGDPFRRFCDMIDKYENVQQLMATGNSPHTVFAPTDAAFSKIEGMLDRIDEQRMLELHILGQARLKRDLRCGQTYRTINTRQDRRNNQRSKTQCISGERSQQLGPGNTVNGLRPTIGNPTGIFPVDEFYQQRQFDLVSYISGNNVISSFSSDIIACNGVIHVVDEVLLPGGQALLQTGYYGATFAGPGHSHAGPYGGGAHTHGGSTSTYHDHSGFNYNSNSLYYNPFPGFRKN